MTKFIQNFYKICKATSVIGAICILGFSGDASGATAKRATGARASASATKTASATKKTTTSKQKTNTITESVSEPEPIIVENKSDQFDVALSDVDSTLETSSTNSVLEAANRRRAELKNQEMAQTAAAATQRAFANGQNTCDITLRQCMQTKCGQNFETCAGDTDTIWGDKMDLCRRDATCTGEEYRLFTTEIKADRDAYAQLGFYNKIVDCGNKFNDCIISECGKNLEKCIGKKNGDNALNACKKISQECQEADSGLSSRANNAFAQLRQVAEKSIVLDEQRLYDLRDEMRDTCTRFGAMFDERTLDCVYTIEFWGGEDNTLFASKKAYAGTEFNCDQNWFGIDTTTFMENAFRLTRSQTSASSAMLGSGVGMAVGAVTSGAIDRAVDRAKAERALGEELCETTGGSWLKAVNLCKCPKGAKFDDESGCQAKSGTPDEEQSEDSEDVVIGSTGIDNNEQSSDTQQAGEQPNENQTLTDEQKKQRQQEIEAFDKQATELTNKQKEAQEKMNNAKTDAEKEKAFNEVKAADKATNDFLRSQRGPEKPTLLNVKSSIPDKLPTTLTSNKPTKKNKK